MQILYFKAAGISQTIDGRLVKKSKVLWKRVLKMTLKWEDI